MNSLARIAALGALSLLCALSLACGKDPAAKPAAGDAAGHEHHHSDAGATGVDMHAHEADAHAHEADAHVHEADAGPHPADAHAHGDDEVNGHMHHDPRPIPPLIPDGGGLQGAITFSNLHARVLVPSCTASSCHGRSFMAYLNLVDKDGAHASLVDQEALGEPCFGKGEVRVVPGSPEKSLLVRKLEGTACGARMPKDAVHLPPEQVELIRAWIYAGAKND